jgi:hypothetical protein
MASNFTNFCYGTVATPPSPPDSGTTMVLNPVGGTTWPSVPFNLTIYPVDTGPLTDNAEIVQVTALSGNNVTAMTRGSQGSTPRTILAGDQAANAITVDDLGGGGSDETQAGIADLNPSDASLALTFPSAFASAPAVVPHVAAPDGLSAIIPIVDYSTLTASGVTFRFSFPIPGAGFKLIWIAHPTS